jgi:hypothetical protein
VIAASAPDPSASSCRRQAQVGRRASAAPRPPNDGYAPAARHREGKEFKPDAAMVAQLKAAAAEAHAWLMDKSATDVTPWWPDSQWCVPTPPITVPTDFEWETPNYFGVDARGLLGRSISAQRQSWAPAVSISGPFMTTPASRWRARQPTGCTFRRMCRCASSGPQRSTA